MPDPTASADATGAAADVTGATDALGSFSEPTRAWFRAAFAEPTPAQSGAWDAIGRGRHSLVVAPTGSGKTLSAFLAAIDRLLTVPPADERQQRTRVLYVSPLKALAVDVERNLRAPLTGIRHTADRLGLPRLPEVTVGIRSGDTTPADRRRLQTRPPDILITTPESLFLMLTSQARETLRGLETVILDEVHAVAGTKRGAHLALSLERLDHLLPRPAQRIGLSATVRPTEEVARFLGGTAPVEIVAPPAHKEWDLEVVVPVEDMTNLPGSGLDDRPEVEEYDDLGELADPGDRRSQSIWPHVEERVATLIGEHRSTIVFTNGRRGAERLTARLNEIAAGEDGEGLGVPAQIMAQSGASAGAAPLLARTHHGSVSKEQRALVEDDLKSGRLPAVVATSSLELGIDMGAVDQVVQIASPPSVASALQRVGRAGHQVGEVSKGVFFPQHRGDLSPAAVAVQRMRTGGIESLHVPANPLDVLAQQVVAAVALDEWDVDELYDVVRRAAPYSSLPRSAYDAVLDLLSGRYPSDEFAELRPRITWDRVAGRLAGRPGAQRLAVTSGGTIPDRGLYGVFLVGGEGPGRRVGELDEEMVYESRIGDVFALGATSWRIEDITHDRVLVSPAPGLPGRLPFWKGDTVGRPAELGEAIGEFNRDLAALPETAALERARDLGLDDNAASNLVAYLREQVEATRILPSDTTLLVERFRDELGDWRLVLHSPYGQAVHAPWALAINARLHERYGLANAGSQAIASDDGIVIRIPDTDAEPPEADLVVFEPDEIDDLVTREVGGSALFASRFRECAARALLLPRRDPGRRSPLWQQRQRAAALLDVASRYPSFPIVLETVRECLNDVYDLPALTALLQRIQRREVTVTDVATTQPSPFARTLLFGYVAQFVYEGDSPIAERRAAALSLDQGLLAELLGRAELRELLDPEVLAEVEAELQRTAPDRLARDAEGLVDTIRLLGPLSREELVERSVEGADVDAWLAALAGPRRIAEVRIVAGPAWVVVEDIARLRDGLGVPVPPGTPATFLEPVDDPIGDLVGRYARTHGPFTVSEVAARLGLGVAVVRHALQRLEAGGRVLTGEFRPAGAGEEWCDAEVLRRLRRRSLARLRDEVEPVEPAALARFTAAWHGIQVATGSRMQTRGVDGVLRAVEQLAGAPVPASAVESLVLSARVRDYEPALLDELTATGEIVWAGHGALPGTDGWVSLHLADQAALTLPAPEEPVADELQRRVLEVLAPGGAWFFRQLADQVGSACLTDGEKIPDDASVSAALWALVWSGHATNDTLAPLRALTNTGRGAHRARRTPPRPGRVVRSGPPETAGRWSLLPVIDADPTRRAHAVAERLLDRHGIVTRGAVVSERIPGGFAAAYRVLSAFEESGRCRRGYFVEGLGASQFGTAGAVDRLRTFRDSASTSADEPVALALAATDPANPYGAALAWPELPGDGGHRPGRKAGSVVVLVDGQLVLYVERGGRTLLSWTDDAELLRPAAEALSTAVRRGTLGRLTVEKADGAPLLGSSTPVREALDAAGFVATPRGLRIRG